MFKALAFLLFAVLGAYSAGLLREDLQAVDLIDVARRLEAGVVVSADELSGAVDNLALPVAEVTCRSALLRAATSPVLSLVNRRNQALEFGSWIAAVSDAQVVVDRALACAPSDGNLWLRQAMLHRAVAENPAALAEMILWSGRLAPAEGPTVRARLYFSRYLSASTLELVRPALRSDLWTMLRYGYDEHLYELPVMIAPPLMADAAEMLAELDPERRAHLMSLLARFMPGTEHGD